GVCGPVADGRILVLECRDQCWEGGLADPPQSDGSLVPHVSIRIAQRSDERGYRLRQRFVDGRAFLPFPECVPSQMLGGVAALVRIRALESLDYSGQVFPSSFSRGYHDGSSPAQERADGGRLRL